MSTQYCRACNELLTHSFCDLGLSPISNAFIKKQDLEASEVFYPLRALVCENCYMVQLSESHTSDAHFHEEYVYFSSYSKQWLIHAKNYVEQMINRFQLDTDSKVMEIASNDGYLLQYFVEAGVNCLGVEPTANTAAAARKKGVPTRECFFGSVTAKELSDEGWLVDLLVGNNVLAHVPDINDFVSGVPLVLKSEGVVTFEFPHLLQLIKCNQFDTIYHEHYSYLSLSCLMPVFEKCGLRVFDVECLSTHGGSLRLFLSKCSSKRAISANVNKMLALEKDEGLLSIETYQTFGERVFSSKCQLLKFLISAKEEGKKIVAYGAAAKGNTLLNYCGVGEDFIDFVADKNTVKQGRFLPGVRIPVVDPRLIEEAKPDYLLILPWNLKDEVMDQLSYIREWGGKFVIPIPEVEIFS